MVDTAGTRPRLSPLLDLHTQKLKPIDVRLYPILTRVDVLFELTQQVTGKLGQLTLVHLFGKVGVKLVFIDRIGVDLDLCVTRTDADRLRVFDLDLDIWLLLHHIVGVETQRGWIESLVDVHLLALLGGGLDHRLGDSNDRGNGCGYVSHRLDCTLGFPEHLIQTIQRLVESPQQTALLVLALFFGLASRSVSFCDGGTVSVTQTTHLVVGFTACFVPLGPLGLPDPEGILDHHFFLFNVARLVRGLYV